MMTQTIQRQYDEVIAFHYDLDHQSVTGSTLDRAARQICTEQLLDGDDEPLRVLDVGMGTGMFLAKLIALGGDAIQPFGIDLSAKMVENAYQKIPNLVAAIDDAVNLDAHFLDQPFDLICTHFLSGFVPLSILAPKICSRLQEGGYWSYIGATKVSFPTLQAKANSRLIRWLSGGRSLRVDDLSFSPANRQEIFQTLEQNGFVVRQCETYQPALKFRNMDEFMDFAYRGGWLTPFIEALGLHKSGWLTQWMLNRFFFPVEDHHSIEIHLAQKVTR